MIGIFDSGVGGLTVAREIKKRIPEKGILYFGDTARVPWGNKSPEIVCRYAKEICQFLISKGATKIVIACNTASAFAGDFLQKEFPDIEIYNVIDPVIEKVTDIENINNLKVGVIGTRGTVSSGVYENRLKNKNPNISVYSSACPLFVSLVEEGWTKGQVAEIVTEEYLKDLKKRGISKIILGCTHYPLLKEVICSFLGKNIECIGSDEEVAKSLTTEKDFFENKSDTDLDDKFYFSDLSESYLRLAENIYGKHIKAEKIKL